MPMQPDYSRQKYQGLLFQILKVRAQKGAGNPKEPATSSQLWVSPSLQQAKETLLYQAMVAEGS